MTALAFDWLKLFTTSSLQPLNGFWRNLTGSKSTTPSIKFVFFVRIGNPRWPPWPLIGWNIFRLLLRNRWMDFDETLQEASPQRPLSCLCFSCRSEIQDGRPGLWLAETFFGFFSITAEWILTKRDRKQVSSSCFSCRSEIQDCHPGLWLAETFLDFSATAEWILTNFDRTQVLNALYQVCVFVPIGNPRWPPWPLIGWNIFRLLLHNRWMDFDETWQEASIKFVFFMPIGNPRLPPWPLISWNISRLLRNRWMDFDELWQDTSPQRPLSSLCFCADRKYKMAALASDWLKRFSASSPQPLNGFWRNLIGSKSSTPSIKFVFFVPIGNPRWPPWPLIGWNIFDFFSTTVEWILTKLDRKQIFNTLYQVCVFCADRKSKMAALASDMLKHFSTSSPQLLNGVWRNLTGSNSSKPSIKFVFFVPIRNPRWPPWPLIGWNIFWLLVRRPFQWHHAMTLTFDLLLGQLCCHAEDHNSLNLLVLIRHHPILGIYQFHHVCMFVHPLASL